MHKNRNHFSYFSHTLKPILLPKVVHLKDYILQTFCGGHSMILDSKVLLNDTKTAKPLPFGTWGVHQKAAFPDANFCLFFDCIYFNVSLMDRPLCEQQSFFLITGLKFPTDYVLRNEASH